MIKADRDINNLTDSGYIKCSGLGMPSSRYINLTLGATGSTYTAPANGYYILKKIANSDTSSANLTFAALTNRNTIYTDSERGNYGFQFCCKVFARKGDIIVVDYNATGTTDLFRFIYAEGAQ